MATVKYTMATELKINVIWHMQMVPQMCVFCGGTTRSSIGTFFFLPMLSNFCNNFFSYFLEKLGCNLILFFFLFDCGLAFFHESMFVSVRFCYLKPALIFTGYILKVLIGLHHGPTPAQQRNTISHFPCAKFFLEHWFSVCYIIYVLQCMEVLVDPNKLAPLRKFKISHRRYFAYRPRDLFISNICSNTVTVISSDCSMKQMK